jgi:hypothetical protein
MGKTEERKRKKENTRARAFVEKRKLQSFIKYSQPNEYNLVFPFLMEQKALLVIVTRVITCTS